MNQEQLKKIILQISAESGDYLRNHFYTFKNVFHKDVGSLLTNVDMELEDILIKRISKEYPDHGIIVHGSKKINPETETVWVLDPLDGSSHFSRNIPIYTSNIAVQHKGETIFGAVNHAQTHQLFFAQKGRGAFLNGVDIRVSERSETGSAYVFMELPERKYAEQEDFEKNLKHSMRAISNLLQKTAQVESFRIGSFGQCLVAAGSFDAYIDLSGTSSELSQAAAQLIVRESGGLVIDLKDRKDGFVQVMVSNPHISEDIKKIINE